MADVDYERECEPQGLTLGPEKFSCNLKPILFKYNCRVCGKAGESAAHNRKYCKDCRRAASRRKPGDQDILCCVVCGHKGYESDFERHHIQPRKNFNPPQSGAKVTLCKNCHRAVHFIRKNQDAQLNNQQKDIFFALVNQCETRHYLKGKPIQ